MEEEETIKQLTESIRTLQADINNLLGAIQSLFVTIKSLLDDSPEGDESSKTPGDPFRPNIIPRYLG